MADRKPEIAVYHPGQCCEGYCVDRVDAHNLRSDEAQHIAAQVRRLMADAWDAGATKASPHGGGYLRSLLIENPHRSTCPAKEADRD